MRAGTPSAGERGPLVAGGGVRVAEHLRIDGALPCNQFVTTGGPHARVATVAIVNTGDNVPDFELPDQDGRPRRLTEILQDGPVVLFFYPAAMTAGCTKEACHFRDLGAEFAAAGVQRIGISRDSVEKQRAFADKHAFDYPLLSDADGEVAKIFGVQRGALGQRLGAPVKRYTFAIGKDRRVVKAIHSEVDMDRHADEALRAFTAV
jgi:peroxiredoxin Q/BCP